MNERPIPPAALRDQNSVEMLRVWVAEHKLHCSLKIGMYREMKIQEEVAWGTILADAARHIARALSEEGEDSEITLLGKIRAQLNAELDMPSSAVTGGFVES
jgi:hypothetical protein